jgi:hypothetical protein
MLFWKTPEVESVVFDVTEVEIGDEAAGFSGLEAEGRGLPWAHPIARIPTATMEVIAIIINFIIIIYNEELSLKLVPGVVSSLVLAI